MRIKCISVQCGAFLLIFIPSIALALQCQECATSITTPAGNTYSFFESTCQRGCESNGCQWRCADGQLTSTPCSYAQVGGGGCLCGTPDCQTPRLITGCGGPECEGSCKYTADDPDAYIAELSYACQEATKTTAVDITGKKFRYNEPLIFSR